MTRWSRRLLFCAIAVLGPALAGCEAGLNAPTLTYHPASNGASVAGNGVSVSNAFVLGPALNSTLPSGGRAGVFLALVAQHADRLISVSAPGTATSVKLAGGSVALAPQAPVDLSGPQPAIVLTGLTSPLSGGQTIQLVLDFANAGVVAFQVPVEPSAYDYATFSPPAIPTATATPTGTATPKPRGSAGPSATASAAGGQPTASPSPSATP